MAADKSTGKSRKKAARKVSASTLPIQLRAVAVELRYALSTITVAAHALREQNSDIDADVALTLQRSAGAPLHAGLERVEALLGELAGAHGTRSEHGEECIH
jgi:hypothetical protein